MHSTVRTKAKPKKTNKEPLRVGIRIRVDQLRVGDRIVTSWHKPGQAALAADLSDEETMQVLESRGEERYVNTSKKVERKEECPGQWRTHIHVNKSDCYDARTYIWIVQQ